MGSYLRNQRDLLRNVVKLYGFHSFHIAFKIFKLSYMKSYLNYTVQ